MSLSFRFAAAKHRQADFGVGRKEMLGSLGARVLVWMRCVVVEKLGNWLDAKTDCEMLLQLRVVMVDGDDEEESQSKSTVTRKWSGIAEVGVDCQVRQAGAILCETMEANALRRVEVLAGMWLWQAGLEGSIVAHSCWKVRPTWIQEQQQHDSMRVPVLSLLFCQV
jgi:hypothetical protein